MAVNEEREDQPVPAAAPRGFVSGFLGALQDRFLAATGRERQTNPDWLANNHEVLAVNTEIMAATAERITLLGHEVQAWKGSLSGEVTRLLDERAQAVEDLRALQESMAYDQVNVDRMNMSYWPADVQARRQKLSQLQGANDQLREQQLQRPPVRQSKFVKGYIALGQSRIFGSFDPGQHEESPSWEENTSKAGSVNRQFMQDSATTLALLEGAIAATDPLDSAAHLVGLHSDVTGAREAVADMISEDDDTKGVLAWAWTDEQMAAQEKLVRGLDRITQSLPGQSQLNAPQAQPKAAEIAPEGFHSDFVELYHSRKYGTGPASERGENPSWRENTEKAMAVNSEFLVMSSSIVSQLDADIESMTSPHYERTRASLVALRTDVSEVRESVEEMIAQDKDTKNAEAWGWTDAELNAQTKGFIDLYQVARRLSVDRQLRGDDSREAAARPPAAEPSTRRSTPARNANTAQVTTPRRAATGVAKSAGRAVVMNPHHAAGLQGLEDNQDEGMESEGGYGR